MAFVPIGLHSGLLNPTKSLYMDPALARRIQPSGPRRPGEGVENEEQGLISAKAINKCAVTTDGVALSKLACSHWPWNRCLSKPFSFLLVDSLPRIPSARRGEAVVLRVTLLAAGFLIGPSGCSVRDIMHSTGCDIRSWTEKSGRKWVCMQDGPVLIPLLLRRGPAGCCTDKMSKKPY